MKHPASGADPAGSGAPHPAAATAGTGPHAGSGGPAHHLVEGRTIDAVPETERHGRPRDLFAVWFAANISPLTIVSGTIAPLVFGLGLWPAVAAVTLGNLLGGFLMALHAAQGPRLGVPQMIQSRGQFGSHGSLLVTLVVVFMYAGWFASNLVIAGQALNRSVPAVDTSGWLVLCALAGLVVAVVGYRLIHRVGRWATVVTLALLALCAVRVFLTPGVLERATNATGFTLSGFVGMTAIGILLQITYAPYVSDYTRYMPAHAASRRSTLWFTYWGSVLGSVLPMFLGIVMGIAVADDAIAGLDTVLGGTLSAVVLCSFAVIVVHVNSMNLYGTSLCLVTAAQTFRHTWLPGRLTRTALIAGPLALGLTLALAFQDTFLASYTDFLAILQYVLIPWTAINLVDYYLIRRGNYHVPSFFAPGGGVYGRINGPAVLVYAVSFALEVPFMHTSAYTGPVASALDGIDLSWAVGLAVPTVAYWLIARRRTAPDLLPTTAPALPQEGS
ncbi:purine-cytosine permease family protein [Streptomyces chrestomyceticus]|uniref:purine-cytosine permease family protein n=1 Tax=Streptomyces chrestomyceticus TaxID=68185 RepID=UPI00368B6777